MKAPAHIRLRGLLLWFIGLYILIAIGPACIYFYFEPGFQHDPGGKTPSSSQPPDPSMDPSTDPQASPSASPSAPPDFLSGLNLGEGAAEPAGDSNTAASPSPRSFTLYDQSAQASLQVEEREFLKATLACEMDLAGPKEALKAQAVAAYSYYSRLRQEGQLISCDTENWLVYVHKEAMQARWGEDYQEYMQILDQVVDQVYGQTLQYQGQAALCLYFAISPGSTEAAPHVFENLYADKYPYLRAVSSPGDMLCDGYLSTVSMGEDELREKLSAYTFPGGTPDLSGPAESWLSDLQYSPSGTVQTCSLGGVTVTGVQLREALGLRSAGFSYEYGDGQFQFFVHGWGHGVGMSQAGAVFMAKRGASYQDILAHYYPGAELVS